MIDVFDPNIDSLFNVTISHSLVNNDTDSRFSDVINDTCLAVVDFMGHAKRRQVEGNPISLVSGQYREQGSSHPFWTAPLALMSTISPTL